MSSPEIALAFALLLQFAGLVWGASKISTSVTTLNTTVEKLDGAVRHLDARIQNHEVRVSVLEHLKGSDAA